MIAVMSILATAGNQPDDGSPYLNLVVLLVMVILLASVSIVIRNENRRGGHHRQITPHNWQANNQQARIHTRHANRPVNNSGRDNIPRPKTW